MENKQVSRTINQYIQYLDIELCRKSNIAVYGLSGCGKSRLACSIASILRNHNYFVAYIDVVGNIKHVSDLPYYLKVDPKKWCLILRTEGILIDISELLLEEQLAYIDQFFRIYWTFRKANVEWKRQAIIILEESELYCQYLRSKTAQQIFRIVMSGRNEPIRTRVMAISPRIANVDTSISEMCEQIYLGSTIGERNAVKIRALLGKEYIDIARELETGQFIWKHGKQIDIVKVPLFERETRPIEIREPSCWQKLKGDYRRVI